MNKQYTEEELKKIEESRKLSKKVSPIIGFLVGTVGISIFAGNVIIGLIGGVVVAGIIVYVMRKN
jgi:hypothetical protein